VYLDFWQPSLPSATKRTYRVKLVNDTQEPATECNYSRILSRSDRGCGRRRVGPAIAGRLAQTEATT
jgi:hypothetical protein